MRTRFTSVLLLIRRFVRKSRGRSGRSRLVSVRGAHHSMGWIWTEWERSTILPPRLLSDHDRAPIDS